MNIRNETPPAQKKRLLGLERDLKSVLNAFYDDPSNTMRRMKDAGWPNFILRRSFVAGASQMPSSNPYAGRRDQRADNYQVERQFLSRFPELCNRAIEALIRLREADEVEGESFD